MFVAFFGHHDTNAQVVNALFNTVAKLAATHKRVDCLIGHQGQFDRLALHTLTKMQKDFPNIRCTVVLSRITSVKLTGIETVYPECVAKTPPRFAIIARNHWMIDKADLVVLNLEHSPSNVALCKQYADRKSKPIIIL